MWRHFVCSSFKLSVWQMNWTRSCYLGAHRIERTPTSRRSHWFAYADSRWMRICRHLEYVQHSQTVWHEKWRSICSAVFSIALCIFHVFNFHLTIGLQNYGLDYGFQKKISEIIVLNRIHLMCCVSVVYSGMWFFPLRSNENKCVRIELSPQWTEEVERTEEKKQRKRDPRKIPKIKSCIFSFQLIEWKLKNYSSWLRSSTQVRFELD